MCVRWRGGRVVGSLCFGCVLGGGGGGGEMPSLIYFYLDGDGNVMDGLDNWDGLCFENCRLIDSMGVCMYWSRVKM